MQLSPSVNQAVNVSSFASCMTPAEFIANALGDHRTAEVAAWKLWEQSGRQSPHNHIAVAIAEDYFTRRTVTAPAGVAWKAAQ